MHFVPRRERRPLEYFGFQDSQRRGADQFEFGNDRFTSAAHFFQLLFPAR